MNKLLFLFLSFFILKSASATVADSVGTKNINGKDYVIYMVNAGETVYGISSKYKVPISELLELNPELENGLKTGQLISLPYNEAFANRNAKPVQQSSTFTEKTELTVKPENGGDYTIHTVKPGETLYSIAKIYGITVDDIMKANNMDVKAGQSLVIKGAKTTEKPKETNTTNTTTTSVTQITETQEKEVVQEQKTNETFTGENYSNPALKTKKRVLLVPFDPYLYFSDADDEMARHSRMTRPQVRQVFRKRLNALIEPRGYETLRMIGGGHNKDTIDDVNKVYASVTYNYQKTVTPKNIMPEGYQQPKSGGVNNVSNWVNNKINNGNNNNMQSGNTNSKGLQEMYFGVKVKDPEFFNYFNNKYLIDYYIFVSQFEVKTNYENCLDRSRGDYERDFIVHYSIFNKKGEQIAGNRIKIFYNSNANDVWKIASDNMQKAADAILADVPHPNDEK